ncbi:hypothetical protein NIES22_01430 [Calothrix brevissima NIES-22]|nr:hypothetical protein NIES22_01430 [Calothrix brevissima NIES-22]
MKILPLSLAIFLLLINLIGAYPSWAVTHIYLADNSHYFEVGEKVIWLYKPRADSADIQKIPAEVVKLSSKQVQIKVRKNQNEFVNRWVNPNKLESFPQISDSAFR